MELDLAVAKLLNIEVDDTTVSSVGGGGCSSASTWKITTRLRDGTERIFFMKTGHGKDSETMFQGEEASLRSIHSVVPSLCPQSFGHGRFSSSSSTYFLVTEFLHLFPAASSSSKWVKAGSAPSLASQLAKLHTTPAPLLSGYSKPQYGFHVTTCCGDTPQDNSYHESWAEFYANNRLRYVLGRIEKANGDDAELRKLVEAIVSIVVPRLLGDGHLQGVVPVLIHGDLWSGNTSLGTIGTVGGQDDVHSVIYDPSAYYAHSEFELGIMNMFGGFGSAFLEEYHGLCPKAEPVEEYEDRIALYELYHHLNHLAMFGGSYRSGAVQIMSKLLQKYNIT